VNDISFLPICMPFTSISKAQTGQLRASFAIAPESHQGAENGNYSNYMHYKIVVCGFVRVCIEERGQTYHEKKYANPGCSRDFFIFFIALLFGKVNELMRVSCNVCIIPQTKC